MIQVRVAQQSAVSVRIAGAAPVRVDVTGTAVVSAPEYSGPYDITPLFTAQVLPTAKKLMQKDVTIRKIPHGQQCGKIGQLQQRKKQHKGSEAYVLRN